MNAVYAVAKRYQRGGKFAQPVNGPLSRMIARVARLISKTIIAA